MKYILPLLILLFALPVSAETFEFKIKKLGWNIPNVEMKIFKKPFDNQSDKVCGVSGMDGQKGVIWLRIDTIECQQALEGERGIKSHELIHLWDFQHGNISAKVAKDWECYPFATGGLQCSSVEKFAYWINEYLADEKFVKTYYPRIYKDIKKLINNK